MISRLAILLEEPGNHAVEFRRQLRIAMTDRRGIFGEQLLEDDWRRGTVERPCTCRELIEHDAERPEIRPGIDVFTAGLLWRHVCRGAERDPGFGVNLRPRDVRGARRQRCHHGKAEVENFDLSFLRHEHVRRLEIAMDDARRVRRGQAVRDLDGEVEQPADVVRRLNRRAIHALHYEVRRPHVVELTDIRMIQGGDGARFALEAFRELGSGCLIATRRSRRVSRAV